MVVGGCEVDEFLRSRCASIRKTPVGSHFQPLPSYHGQVTLNHTALKLSAARLNLTLTQLLLKLIMPVRKLCTEELKARYLDRMQLVTEVASSWYL